MRIAGIRFTSLFDGEGINAVVFFQGCAVHCKGCHNPGTWDFTGGTEVSIDEVTKQIEPYIGFIDGITLSGGNPVDSWVDASALAQWAKSKRLKVTLYSGYDFADIAEMDTDVKEEHKLLEYVDTVIDGAFELDKKADLPFRGSSNQRIFRITHTEEGWKATNDKD